MTTLYKLDKKGKMLVWSIDYDDCSYWTVTGQEGGKMTTTAPTFCEAKNVGKANERTVAEQVKLEVESKVKKQYDNGYSLERPTAMRFEVSLANKYQDRKAKGKLDYPYIINPKLDGIRCYIKMVDGVVRAFSRKHKEFVSIPHIVKSPIIDKLFKLNPDVILDGELYNHELKDDFNEIVSIVRKSKPTFLDLWKSASKIRFNCFDCFYQSMPAWGYSTRNGILQAFFVNEHYEGREIVFVGSNGIDCAANMSYEMVQDDEGVEECIQRYIEQGFEGIMLKKPGRGYCFGRSDDLLKYKYFKDAEYTLVDFEEGKGNLAGIAAAALMEDNRGVRFKVGVTGTQEYARSLFENKEKYIGKPGTVKYQELTPVNDDGSGGVPRFGKLVSLRDYE